MRVKSSKQCGLALLHEFDIVATDEHENRRKSRPKIKPQRTHLEGGFMFFTSFG